MCECSNLAAIRPVGNGASSQAAAAAERLDGAAAKRKATHRLVESTKRYAYARGLCCCRETAFQDSLSAREAAKIFARCWCEV